MSDFKMKGVLKVINPSVQVSEKFTKRATRSVSTGYFVSANSKEC
jgi:hypothetical protein